MQVRNQRGFGVELSTYTQKAQVYRHYRWKARRVPWRADGAHDALDGFDVTAGLESRLRVIDADALATEYVSIDLAADLWGQAEER